MTIKITEVDLKHMYDDMLDEVYGNIKIGELCFWPSRILHEMDPVAYRCGKNDYGDSLTRDGEYVIVDEDDDVDDDDEVDEDL